MKYAINILLALFLVVSLGCAKDKKSNGGGTTTNNNNSGGSHNTPPGSGGGDGTGTWTEGATASLKIVSLSVMSQYVQRSLKGPQNVRVNLNLQDFGGGKYGGTVMIGYTDNGQYYEGAFEGGDDDSDNRYNVWFTHNSEQVFHGFFADPWGAVVVVIDKVLTFGDGPVDDKVSGSIWFKNFADYGPYTAPPPPTQCWFVSLGPYDCQTFKSGGKVVTTSAVYPSTADGYKKLGDFEDLSLSKAFNSP